MKKLIFTVGLLLSSFSVSAADDRSEECKRWQRGYDHLTHVFQCRSDNGPYGEDIDACFDQVMKRTIEMYGQRPLRCHFRK